MVTMFVIYAVMLFAKPDVFRSDGDFRQFGFEVNVEGEYINESSSIQDGMFNSSASSMVASNPFGFLNTLSLIWDKIIWAVSILILPLALFRTIEGFPLMIALILGGVWILMYAMAIFSFIRGNEF